MNKKDKAIGFLLVCMIVGLTGVIVFQQYQMNHLQINEQIPINEIRDWGATVYMTVYRDGAVLSEESHHNLIPDAARSALRGHIADSALAVWNYLAIGTSTGGGTGSTTLENEFLRAVAEYAIVGSFNFSLTFTWTEGNFSGQTVTEYGVFNDPSTGTILSYDDNFSRGPLTADDTLQVTAMFQIGS